MIIERMSSDLGVPQASLQMLARGASYQYKHYRIAKKSGGFRDIYHPSRRLKAAQRWLLGNMLTKLSVHEAAKAYVKGSTIVENARMHASSKYLLRMDLRNFFPSIKESDLDLYTADRSSLFQHYSFEDYMYLKLFLFRHGALTIGAPTSPALSNVLCFDLDTQLSALAVSRNVLYSRYADDLFFSCTEAEVLPEFPATVADVVRTLRIPNDLEVNEQKTRHSSKRGARHVTGIVLGSDSKIHLGRAKKREIRSLIFKFDGLMDSQKEALVGRINQAVSVEPSFMNDLILKFGSEKLSAIRRFRAMERDLRIPANVSRSGNKVGSGIAELKRLIQQAESRKP